MKSMKKMRSSFKAFLVALVVVTLVLGLFALPYSLIQTYRLIGELIYEGIVLNVELDRN